MASVFSVVSGITSSFGPVVENSFAMISSANRSIGTVFPDVVVEEVHHDEMNITQQPVESGAPVTDHAFMMPVRVEIHCMWSDSGQSAGYSKAVYAKMIAQQQTAQPFDVSTGKRQYKNMLFASILQKTNDATEWALDIIAVCQEIIIAKATTTGNTGGGSGGSGGSGDPNSPTTPSNGTFDPSQSYDSSSQPGLAASLGASGAGSPSDAPSNPGIGASVGAGSVSPLSGGVGFSGFSPSFSTAAPATGTVSPVFVK